MKARKELEELRRHDPKALLAELERERRQLSREMIAVKLGKQTKISELRARKRRVARILTVLAEKVKGAA
jgi:ribosomal protein L29